MEVFLTKAQAYRAMFCFLEKLYDENPHHELGGILGSMRLLDDSKPADEGLIERWSEAVNQIKSVQTGLKLSDA